MNISRVARVLQLRGFIDGFGYLSLNLSNIVKLDLRYERILAHLLWPADLDCPLSRRLAWEIGSRLSLCGYDLVIFFWNKFVKVLFLNILRIRLLSVSVHLNLLPGRLCYIGSLIG